MFFANLSIIYLYLFYLLNKSLICPWIFVAEGIGVMTVNPRFICEPSSQSTNCTQRLLAEAVGPLPSEPQRNTSLNFGHMSRKMVKKMAFGEIQSKMFASFYLKNHPVF
jgi:hypothetical protein